MRIERTSDVELIRSVLTHPRVHAAGSDDFAPPIEEFQPTIGTWLWYLAAYDGEELLGLFVTYPLNMACWDVHIALLPTSWGPRALEAGRKFLVWMWTYSPARRITAHVPAYNRLAAGIARRAGFAEVGQQPKAFLKRGRLHDLRILGISKPEELPCHP